MTEEYDPIEALRDLGEHILRTSEVPESLPRRLDEGVDRPRPNRSRPNPHRRWAIISLAAAGTVVLGGVAAAMWTERQPDRPDAESACRPVASLDGDTSVLEPGDDPIDGCALAGPSDNDPDPEGPLPDQQPAPSATACTGSGDVVEVFPGETTTCDTVGQTPSEGGLSDGSNAVIHLRSKITKLNERPCRSAEEVRGDLADLLRDAGLDAWTITVNSGRAGATCAKAGIDPAVESAYIFFAPPPPPPTQED